VHQDRGDQEQHAGPDQVGTNDVSRPEFGCDLQPIDFAAVAEGFGIKGFRIVAAEQCGSVLEAALRHSGPALVEAIVDANGPLLPPKRIAKYADTLAKALRQGTADKEAIERALQEEPARSMLEE